MCRHSTGLGDWKRICEAYLPNDASVTGRQVASSLLRTIAPRRGRLNGCSHALAEPFIELALTEMPWHRNGLGNAFVLKLIFLSLRLIICAAAMQRPRVILTYRIVNSRIYARRPNPLGPGERGTVSYNAQKGSHRPADAMNQYDIVDLRPPSVSRTVRRSRNVQTRAHQR